MSERYLVTGVQLGLLISALNEQARKEIVALIIDKQFIGNSKSSIIDDANSMAKVWE